LLWLLLFGHPSAESTHARGTSEWIACALVTAPIKRLPGRLGAVLAIAAGALLLRVVCGVGFANYDTLYALAWAGQLSRGETPAYGVPIAPTPHPLVEALGVVLSPLSPRAVENVTVALGLLALSGCAWVVYRLGEQWFGRAAGALAALILLTRVPILSYGVRAYVDIPYLLLVLSALLVESRCRHAGAPVLALLALAGLLRPEAWAFSGLYWLYMVHWLFAGREGPAGRRPRTGTGPSRAERSSRATLRKWTEQASQPGRARQIAVLTLLAIAAPLIWVLSDLAVTGHPLWSLTNTRNTARALHRITGIGNVPEYIPRRIGEILRPPVLAAAALGGALSLLWLRRRALPGAAAGLLAVVVFAIFAAIGLPINTRYAFLAAAILCVFAGAGAFGWARLAREDPRRRWWMAAGTIVLVALLAYAPAQYRSAHRELDKLAHQQSIQDDLIALVDDRSITLACGPVGVPNHAPVPLLALYLHASPARVQSAQVARIARGEYIDPASRDVEESYVLDPRDPNVAVGVPPGFTEVRANRSWLVLRRCAP
jgi:hypothetical protein